MTRLLPGAAFRVFPTPGVVSRAGLEVPAVFPVSFHCGALDREIRSRPAGSIGAKPYPNRSGRSHPAADRLSGPRSALAGGLEESGPPVCGLDYRCVPAHPSVCLCTAEDLEEICAVSQMWVLTRVPKSHRMINTKVFAAFATRLSPCRAR